MNIYIYKSLKFIKYVTNNFDYFLKPKILKTLKFLKIKYYSNCDFSK